MSNNYTQTKQTSENETKFSKELFIEWILENERRELATLVIQTNVGAVIDDGRDGRETPIRQTGQRETGGFLIIAVVRLVIIIPTAIDEDVKETVFSSRKKERELFPERRIQIFTCSSSPGGEKVVVTAGQGIPH